MGKSAAEPLRLQNYEEGSETKPVGSQLWTRENLAWIAGIVEGEGTIRWTKAAPRRADGSHPGGQSLDVSVGMTDEDVIRHLSRLVGAGIIFGPYQPKPITRKPTFQYKLNGANAYALLMAILPWLHSRRRQQATIAIRSWLLSHPKRSLDAAQVAAIREEIALGLPGTASRLAREYDVTPSTIHNVAKGKTYKWANGPLTLKIKR